MGFECVSSDESTSDIELVVTVDGNSDIQSWSRKLEQVDSDMKQMEHNVAHMWWQSSLEWNLTLVDDGTIQLETPIRSMEELFMFTQASIRYLSPFSGLFMKQPVRFTCESLSITLGVSTDVKRKELMNPRRKKVAIMKNSSSKYDFTSVSTLNHHAIIDHLVLDYLEYYNPYMGLLHRKTFLKYYRSIDNLMDDALILAVCVDALLVLRFRNKYTTYETSMLIRMFYDRCKDMLFDMYDDPTQKLSIVVITSLISRHVADVLLRHVEASRLVSIALLVCTDLFESRAELTNVQWVIFQRNYTHIQLLNRQYAMLYDNQVNFAMLLQTGYMEVLEDEPEVTKNSMQLINEILRLIGSSYISSLLVRRRQ